MKFVLALAAFTLILPFGMGCGGPTDYNSDVEKGFVQGCAKSPQATEALCQCMYDEIKKAVPFAKFKAESIKKNEGKPFSPEMTKVFTKVAMTCVKQTPAKK